MSGPISCWQIFGSLERDTLSGATTLIATLVEVAPKNFEPCANCQWKS
jgi:hypothetical protein